MEQEKQFFLINLQITKLERKGELLSYLFW